MIGISRRSFLGALGAGAAATALGCQHGTVRSSGLQGEEEDMSVKGFMQIVCEGHRQILGKSQGVRVVVRKPEVLPDPVVVGDSAGDRYGASIYGTVKREEGMFRMWYQGWPRMWGEFGKDMCIVCYAESDDGITWRKPDLGLIELEGGKKNNVTDLPFHSQSIHCLPGEDPTNRFRAFGTAREGYMQGLFNKKVGRYGYYTAHSADGIHWTIEDEQPFYEHADVMTAAYDPWDDSVLLMMKNNQFSHGLFRRTFFEGRWKNGLLGEPVRALAPDEIDDMHARMRGLNSADYYGVGLLPTAGPVLGFLWNFRHTLPLGDQEELKQYGNRGPVDLSLVYQLERGGRWLHLAGRPDWLSAAEMPPWAAGCIYTASEPLEVGDETWLYFTGTANLHGLHGHGVDRKQALADIPGGISKIGLAKWPTNRLMGFKAGVPGRVRLARAVEGGGQELRINAETAPGGRVRARLLDGEGKPIEGFDFEDCVPLGQNALDHAFAWKGGVPAQAELAEVELRDATLYAFAF